MKLRKIYSVIGMVLALTTLTNCTSDDAVAELSGKKMLQITAEIDAQSRAMDTRTSFVNNDKIGIFLSTGKDADCKAVDNIYATYYSGKWTLSRDFDLSDYPQGLNLMAYYPYSSDANLAFDSQNGTVVVTGQNANEDLMVSNMVTATTQNYYVALNFSHILSNLTLKITKGSAYSGNAKLTKVKITGITNMLDDGDKIVCDGSKAWTESEKADLSDAPSYTVQNLSTTLSSNAYSLQRLFLPQTPTGQTKVELTVDDKTFQFALPLEYMLNGHNYVFNLVVDEIITNVPEKIYIGDYEAIYLGINSQGKPLYWADRNVGAPTSADSGSYFSWGSVTAATNFPADNFTGSTSTSSISGTDKDAARSAMKYGWRIPTSSEMEQLIYLDRQKTTVGDSEGWTFTGKNSNTIYLPCAGCYYGDRLFSFGESGYYWTANAVNASTATVLNLSWSSVYMLAGWDKTQGCSVRAVISI